MFEMGAFLFLSFLSLLSSGETTVIMDCKGGTTKMIRLDEAKTTTGNISSHANHETASYGNNINCRLKFILNDAVSVKLTFKYLDLEKSIHRCEDKLVISEEGRTQQYCGKRTPWAFYSSKPMVELHFTTDGSHGGKGFFLNYTYVPLYLSSGCGSPRELTVKPWSSKHIIIGKNNTYPDNLDCRWNITPVRRRSLRIQIELLNLEMCSGCQCDYIKVYQGKNEHGRLKALLCGTDGTENHRVFPNNQIIIRGPAHIHFHSDNSNSGKGFSLRIRTSSSHSEKECGSYVGNLKTPQYISSMNFPKPSDNDTEQIAHPRTTYENNAKCEWRLRSDYFWSQRKYYHIMIHVALMDIEDAPDCAYDSLEVYDGQNDKEPLLKRLCGFGKDIKVEASAGNDVFIRFVSDNSITKKGFLIRAMRIRNDSIPTTTTVATTVAPLCGVTTVEDATEGNITSRNYPDNYPRRESCVWELHAKPGFRIAIEFIDFDVERARGCRYDHLSIYDGCCVHTSLDQIGKYCGNVSPPPITSTGPKLYLNFRSDYAAQRSGFLIRYVAYKPPEIPHFLQALGSSGCGSDRYLNSSTGTILSHPNFGNGTTYGTYLSCKWNIEAPEQLQIIKLNFEHFHLEQFCRYDRLQIFDGESENAPKLLEVCGMSVFGGTRLQSSGRHLHLVFTTDNQNQQAGFNITYVATYPPVTCGTNQFKCENNDTCLPMSVRCDGENDCTDGSDETGCINATSCGIPAIAPVVQLSKIVGGTTARAHSWPWQVQVLKFGVHNCGATLISNQWVLSAAHCFENGLDQNLVPTTLKLGAHHRTGPPGIKLRVSKVFMHPQFKNEWKRLIYDFALLKLQRPLEFSDEVSPACMPSRNLRAGHEQKCVSTGWGSTRGIGSGNPTFLQQADVPIIPADKCNSTSFYKGIITNDMLCAGYPNGGKDACDGDSGGPFVCKVDGKWQIHGVTSWGEDCAKANKPGVYANVHVVLEWIQDVIKLN